MRLGVRCVSVYAFAIENFKRSPEEVAALMTLAEEKLTEMSKHGYVSVFALRCRSHYISVERCSTSTAFA